MEQIESVNKETELLMHELEFGIDAAAGQDKLLEDRTMSSKERAFVEKYERQIKQDRELNEKEKSILLQQLRRLQKEVKWRK